MAEVDNFETYEEAPAPVIEKVVAPPAELPEIKLFGRWACDDVQMDDMSLQVGF